MNMTDEEAKGTRVSSPSHVLEGGGVIFWCLNSLLVAQDGNERSFVRNSKIQVKKAASRDFKVPWNRHIQQGIDVIRSVQNLSGTDS